MLFTTGQTEIVRCKDCKYRPCYDPEDSVDARDLVFPENDKCPEQCYSDNWYSWMPEDDWFCANGERK